MAKKRANEIAVGLTVLVVLALTVFILVVLGDWENFFPEKHPLRVSSEIINETFGGSQNISILMEGDIKDCDFVQVIVILILSYFLMKTDIVSNLWLIIIIILIAVGMNFFLIRKTAGFFRSALLLLQLGQIL